MTFSLFVNGFAFSTLDGREAVSPTGEWPSDGRFLKPYMVNSAVKVGGGSLSTIIYKVFFAPSQVVGNGISEPPTVPKGSMAIATPKFAGESFSGP